MKMLLADTQKQAILLESIFMKGFYGEEAKQEFCSKYSLNPSDSDYMVEFRAEGGDASGRQRRVFEMVEALQKGCPEIEYICFDVNTVFDDAALAAERRRILDRTNTLLADGTTVAVYTSRMVLRSEDDQREKNLAISVKISDALTSLVADLTVRPAFVLAKGGITSSDVGVKALRVHCARVRGQIAPGVPVWETG